MQNELIKFREQAVDWLNGARDFDAGIRILEESKFKPGVVAKLKKHGVDGPEASNRLKFLMRELVQAWALPSDTVIEDIDPITGLHVDQEDIEAHTDTDGLKLVDAARMLEEGSREFPVNISSVIRNYAEAYKKRDILHKQLGEMSEDNEEKTMAARAVLIEEIASLSEQMDKLYPLYAQYLEDGKDAADEAVKNLEHPVVKADDGKPDDEPIYYGMSKKDLQKERKSVATKISRARNMLEYQQETKAEKSNPMPECPKRVMYETRIANLTAELEQIDYAIATFG